MSGLVDIFKICPVCSIIFRHILMLPIRDVAFTFWTDGFWIRPMLVSLHRLLPCPHCNAMLWIDEIGIIRCDYADETFRIAPYAKVAPTYKQYLSLFEQGRASKDKEVYLRICMWWLDNDRRRRPTSKAPGLCAREVANIRALVDLLDEDDSYERVLKAEALRELGRFDVARTILDGGVYGVGYQAWAQAIRRLTDRGDARVRLVQR